MHLPQKLDLPQCEVIYHANGITQINYKDVYLTLQDSKYIFQESRKLSPWERSPIYLTSASFTNQDKASREYNGSEEVTQHCSVIAMLSTSLAQRIMANFFIRIVRPKVPTRFFASEQEAMEWLSTFLPAEPKAS
ncbi:hypothetical protein [Flavobacterium sp.]|jgi:hypothetical protein|uniref:DUF7793 family protein n=1 Tax=Flavobacterium sp. TaxID=239 RepID=UPI003919F7D1